ncbi:NAD-dependent deacetylase sirtuin-2 [Eremomyces bilateralis CBS 781.70]|uniref:NAD-dependent protein deacetylase n=1 Tax=Eremomyces bilateralis CBS 781.70 TaxID=1392243 RepID=A0A6G1FUL6_9PEZI|nr:NAD-dependent deacetylase sirtuin-2 [Eremomyces bilateralis CBS 781.70]KAF1809382.1 NAD-dependent deacetylase sirtuin-2 [Eremomyces bilateralis CBS 781.70]
MGQKESSVTVDGSTPPETLESRTIEGVAKYIRDGKAKRVVIMNGAGISTAAGIPDFRSPETGLYANLARLNLPYPEAVFDIGFFKENPYPFYALSAELYPGKYKPTIAHCFVRLLEKKNLLRMCFTQNIDCLEREAGVSDDKIIEAHGSYASQSCIRCLRPQPPEPLREAINKGEPAHCQNEECLGWVKPDIVFFGEALPPSFVMNRLTPAEADLIIVMGTSLTVFPFAGLPQVAREGVPRVLLNNEEAGDLGSRPDDVLALGDIDENVRKLARAIGWLDELEGLWASVAPEKAAEYRMRFEAKEPTKTTDETLEDEVAQLTAEVEKTLKLTQELTERATGKLPDGPPQSEGKDTGQKEEKEQETTQSGLDHVFPHLKKSSL